MSSQCDRLVNDLEMHKGIFSLEYDEGHEKYIKAMINGMRTGGIDSICIPDYLKKMCYKYFRGCKLVKESISRQNNKLKNTVNDCNKIT